MKPSSLWSGIKLIFWSFVTFSRLILTKCFDQIICYLIKKHKSFIQLWEIQWLNIRDDEKYDIPLYNILVSKTVQM